jgi:hypothetical protein
VRRITMWWLLLGIAVVTIAVAIITLAVILKEVSKFIRKHKQVIIKQKIQYIEIHIKEAIEKNNYAKVTINLMGKKKVLGLIPRRNNIGKLNIEGKKIDDEVKKQKTIVKSVEELLS